MVDFSSEKRIFISENLENNKSYKELGYGADTMFHRTYF